LCVKSAILTSLATALCYAADAPKVVSFIACPIYRDTNQGRKSGCWLADDHESGLRYDIGGGRAKPQIGHEVLVEGVIASSPDVCGGAVLVPVHTAVLESSKSRRSPCCRRWMWNVHCRRRRMHLSNG
jgi:hypothetical protein